MGRALDMSKKISYKFGSLTVQERLKMVALPQQEPNANYFSGKLLKFAGIDRNPTSHLLMLGVTCSCSFILFYRVVSYLTNGWENDFIEKYKHLRPDISNAPVPTNSVKKTPDFPQAANWQPILQARTNFPLFTIESMMNYFIERKAIDNKENKDY